MTADSAHYDGILAEIGSFGPWQKRLMVLLWIPSIYTGVAFMTYSFTLGTPSEYRCYVPGCDESPDTGQD